MKRTKIKNKNFDKASLNQDNKTKKNKNLNFELLHIKIFNLINKKTFRFSVFVILFLAYMLILYPKMTFDNYVQFGFDQWNYQAMAVNFAKGHGISKNGAIDNFEEYGFGNFHKYYNGRMSSFINSAGTDNFYRTPGYPFFVGVIYKIFGVSPKIAKQIQQILLFLIFAFIPIFAFWLWKEIGFISGIFASILSAKYGGINGGIILTEPLITVFIFIIALAWFFDNKKKSIVSNIVFGVVSGFSLLVKGNLIFIPFIVFAIKFISAIKLKNKNLFINSIIYLSFVVLTILPWANYASNRAGETIILSTQGKQVLLDGHNEYAQGGWTPGWSSNKDSFYNNDNMEGKSIILRIINFYKHYPLKLPKLAIQKLIFGFIPFVYLWLLFTLIIIENIRNIIERVVKNKKIEFYFLIFVGLPVLTLILYVKYYYYYEFYDTINNNLYFLFIFFILPFILLSIKKINRSKSGFEFKIPEIFIIFFLNFFFLTIIIFGDIYLKKNRFVGVANFMMITLFSYQILAYLKFLINRLKKND